MMEIYVRKAEEKDIDRILSLLKQVLEIHAAIRPDIFVSGTTKYTEEELKMILQMRKHRFLLQQTEMILFLDMYFVCCR